ncbi:MAG: hypothetical protein V4532_05015 [Pseudomonadota bacterium]
MLASLPPEVAEVAEVAEDQLAAIQQSLAVTLASIDVSFVAANRSGKDTHERGGRGSRVRHF